MKNETKNRFPRKQVILIPGHRVYKVRLQHLIVPDIERYSKNDGDKLKNTQV